MERVSGPGGVKPVSAAMRVVTAMAA